MTTGMGFDSSAGTDMVSLHIMAVMAKRRKVLRGLCSGSRHARRVFQA